jgi:hypothetical protein
VAHTILELYSQSLDDEDDVITVPLREAIAAIQEDITEEQARIRFDIDKLERMRDNVS